MPVCIVAAVRVSWWGRSFSSGPASSTVSSSSSSSSYLASSRLSSPTSYCVRRSVGCRLHWGQPATANVHCAERRVVADGGGGHWWRTLHRSASHVGRRHGLFVVPRLEKGPPANLETNMYYVYPPYNYISVIVDAWEKSDLVLDDNLVLVKHYLHTSACRVRSTIVGRTTLAHHTRCYVSTPPRYLWIQICTTSPYPYIKTNIGTM